jgi:hypothetical protein
VNGGLTYTKKDILYIPRQTNKKAFIVDEENIIDIEGLKFIFRKDKLVEVEG